LNQRILQAEETGSVEDLALLLTKGFAIIRNSGEKMDRKKFLSAVPDNANRGRKAEQPRVNLTGSCAIYTCIVTTIRNPDGTPNAGRFWNTRLFVPERGQWRCASWQVMQIVDQ
jgi:hypothetical protein